MGFIPIALLAYQLLNMTFSNPHIIDFGRIGSTGLGYLSVAEKDKLPFVVKRVYWTYHTPESVIRGRHAHYELQQILLAVAGRIEVSTEMPDGKKDLFVLDKPNHGLFIPKMCWREMQYSHNAVQICLASMVYEEEDYIRDYDHFLKLRSEKL